MYRKLLNRGKLRYLIAIGALLGLGMSSHTDLAHAGMDPFIGEVSCNGYNFCPRNYAECNGQLIPIAQNTALFSLLGTTYGGNGTTNFALPDLRGRTVLGQGQGAGLTSRVMGEVGGSEAVTLTAQQMPQHRHGVSANSGSEKSASPTAGIPGVTATGAPVYSSASPDTSMAAGALGNSGGSQPHNNLQPYLAVKCCIAVNGIFPSRP